MNDMGFRVENLNKIKTQYNTYCDNPVINVKMLDPNHMEIRDFFVNNYYELKECGYDKYQIDLRLALRFYKFLNNNKNFDTLYLSNENFWKHIAVFDIPDIVADRFGLNSVLHFYGKGTRVYPYTLYWYIYLSWQGSEEETFNILKEGSTDLIVQLVERTGRFGINVELCRCIMLAYYYAQSDNEITHKFNKKDLFRAIMLTNTSKFTIFRPELYPGGINGYVNMLIDNL